MKKRNLHIISASALFGILVWLSVALQEEYTVTVTAPFSVEGVPAARALSSPIPRTVQFRFRGEGWRLASLMLGADPELRFRFTGSPSEPMTLTGDDFLEGIGHRAGITLLDVRPDSVLLETDRRVERRVPVVPTYTITFRDGYGQIGDAQVRPDSVVVSGAASVLQHLQRWPTQRATFRDIRTSLDVEVPLERSDTYDLSFSERVVHLLVDVQPFAERVLAGIPVEARGVPLTQEILFIPPKIELVVRGGIQRLSTLDVREVLAWVDYQTVVTDTTGIVDVRLETPEGIQPVAKRPERLRYIIRKKL
jgi:hypothetical protein